MALGAAEGILRVQVRPFCLAWTARQLFTSIEWFSSVQVIVGIRPALRVIVGSMILSLLPAGWPRGDRHHSAQFGDLGLL